MLISPTQAQIHRVNRGRVAQNGQIPEHMQFIQDTFPMAILESKSVITEAAGKAVRALQITGIFQKADDTNQNGREYPLEVIASAVNSIQEDIRKRAVLGEYDHPADAKIHLERVSHVITKVWMEGKNVYGVAEVLEEMPYGKMLASLLRSKVQIGISSRGIGDMEEVVTEGHSKHRVLPGYQFVTWDVVAEPSVEEAVMHVMESRDRLITRKNRNPQATLVSEIDKWLRC